VNGREDVLVEVDRKDKDYWRNNALSIAGFSSRARARIAYANMCYYVLSRSRGNKPHSNRMIRWARFEL